MTAIEYFDPCNTLYFAISSVPFCWYLSFKIPHGLADVFVDPIKPSADYGRVFLSPTI